MSRYNDDGEGGMVNDSEYYAPLRRRRGVKRIIHYPTPILYNPTVADRASIATSTHVWVYGDRFYKLADQYYADARYWWAIAWYNGAPTEVDISLGTVIEIPLRLEDLLDVLGV
tara:strand:- start:7590 stop:7931 length:342 start_codon:yes stop_codon:yes gene_type:complete